MAAHKSRRKVLACWLTVGATVVAGGFLSCSTVAQPVSAPGVRVTVLLFSGRPDPTFELTDRAQLARLGALLKQAPPQERGDRETVLPSILGYKGIVVDNPAAIGELPNRFAVYGGAIEVGTERKEFLTDSGNQVALLLLDLAIKSDAVPPSIVGRIKERGLR